MAEEKTLELQPAMPSRMVTAFDEMDRLFDRLLARRGWMRPWRTDWMGMGDMPLPESRVPRVDVLDREDDIQLQIELPGMDKRDIDIAVGEDRITIKGEARHEDKSEGGDYYRCEITRGAFSRTVGLPAGVDGSKAKASFKDGVLTVLLPKAEHARRHSLKID